MGFKDTVHLFVNIIFSKELVSRIIQMNVEWVGLSTGVVKDPP